MNHLNSILLEGVLVDDPRLVIDNGTNKLAKFSIASDRYYISKSGEKQVDTCFIPVQTWNVMADRAVQVLAKGMTVRVVGRLRQNRWTTDEGSSMSSIEIVADHVEYRKGSRGKGQILESCNEEAIAN